MRQKLVFIGRKYHAKTKSDELVLSLLNEQFDVIVIRREEITDQEAVKQINQIKPFAVLFWCLPPSFTFHLLKIKCKNIFWAPMWDGFKPLSFKKRFIFALYNVKVLCFSESLIQYFKKTVLKCGYWRCFLKPSEQKNYKEKGPYTFFFWEREKDISLEKVIEMIGSENIHKVIYKSDINPKDEKEYPFILERLPEWLEKTEYKKKMLEADFFIAPRKAEGIGFSFLEPMSFGMPVIAYDNSTMNEYIHDGVNGHLFGDDFKLKSFLQSPKMLSTGIENLSNNYYFNWNMKKGKLLSFIESEGMEVQ